MLEDDGKKKTPDGQIILDPQPDDSGNDPLNWPAWRRDVALLSLGLYCSKNLLLFSMIGILIPNGAQAWWMKQQATLESSGQLELSGRLTSLS